MGAGVRYRRNPDEDLRDLERRASQGDLGAEASLARARERAGMRPQYVLVDRGIGPDDGQSRVLDSRWAIELDRQSYRVIVHVKLDSVRRQSRMLAKVWRPAHLDWSSVSSMTSTDDAFPVAGTRMTGRYVPRDDNAMLSVERELLDRAAWALFGVAGEPAVERNPYRFR
jgi:hypothetical protein